VPLPARREAVYRSALLLLLQGSISGPERRPTLGFLERGDLVEDLVVPGGKVGVSGRNATPQILPGRATGRAQQDVLLVPAVFGGVIRQIRPGASVAWRVSKGGASSRRSLELGRDARIDRAQAGNCKQQEMEQLHPGWQRLRMWRSGQERWLVVVKVGTAGQVRWPARPRQLALRE